jgi:glycosyltransferase involved in cell wall biosynthesis
MTQVIASTGRSRGAVEINGFGRRLAFITAIPQSVHRGSGCYVGIGTLAAGATALGNHVEMIMPSMHLGWFLAKRYLFNQALRLRREWNYDAIVGFDVDGFALDRPKGVPRIANIKGVLGDAIPFESGFTRASMAQQARWEAEHARNADLVITTSEYCKSRLRELYGVRGPIGVVPELIDLTTWRQLFRANPATKPEGEFTVLCVCRFYPRKRLTLLLRAAHLLRRQIPGLQVRVVGGGPEAASLLRLWRDLELQTIVTWVGEVSRHELAREYNRADVFCLPSVQEGFGIVFLEAMAAGRPIIAARAAAVPEVVRHGLLVEPENAEALADGVWRLWHDPSLRDTIREQQCKDVDEYEMIAVTRRFLQEIGRVARTSTPSE